MGTVHRLPNVRQPEPSGVSRWEKAAIRAGWVPRNGRWYCLVDNNMSSQPNAEAACKAMGEQYYNLVQTDAYEQAAQSFENRAATKYILKHLLFWGSLAVVAIFIIWRLT